MIRWTWWALKVTVECIRIGRQFEIESGSCSGSAPLEHVAAGHQQQTLRVTGFT